MLDNVMGDHGDIELFNIGQKKAIWRKEIPLVTQEGEEYETDATHEEQRLVTQRIKMRLRSLKISKADTDDNIENPKEIGNAQLGYKRIFKIWLNTKFLQIFGLVKPKQNLIFKISVSV